jgi:hypothetical protein
MNVTFRPLPAWPYPEQKTRPDLFKAGYGDTLDLLEREIGYLRGSEVIIGLVTEERSIRLDGRPRSDMRVSYPGVELSFEVDGRRLVFHTDVYRGYVESWQSNLRAIALGLEALRAVSRYGITTGIGEQYAGFLRLETSQADPERGRALVEEAGGSIKKALMTHHPDQGGDPRRFADVQAYRQLTGGGA